MKVQFALTVKDRHGDDLMEADAKNAGKLKAITLADLCCAVLDAQFAGDEREPKEKFRRWELIMAITKAERELAPLDLIDSDVELIKSRLLKSALPATACGSAVELLSKPAVEIAHERSKNKADKTEV